MCGGLSFVVSSGCAYLRIMASLSGSMWVLMGSQSLRSVHICAVSGVVSGVMGGISNRYDVLNVAVMVSGCCIHEAMAVICAPIPQCGCVIVIALWLAWFSIVFGYITSAVFSNIQKNFAMFVFGMLPMILLTIENVLSLSAMISVHRLSKIMSTIASWTQSVLRLYSFE